MPTAEDREGMSGARRARALGSRGQSVVCVVVVLRGGVVPRGLLLLCSSLQCLHRQRPQEYVPPWSLFSESRRLPLSFPFSVRHVVTSFLPDLASHICRSLNWRELVVISPPNSRIFGMHPCSAFTLPPCLGAFRSMIRPRACSWSRFGRRPSSSGCLSLFSLGSF